MIVICTKCQAKFRVADERIGPRGAKVRCSRCQTVFSVQPAPAVDDAAAAASGDGAVLRAVPPPLPPPLPPVSRGAAPDPFADPFAAPLRAAAAAAPDPFGQAADPFATATAAAADPFAPADDPFAAAASPAGDPGPGLGSATGPPLTDLADLLGAAAGGAPRAAASAGEAERSDAPTPSELGLALEERLTPPPVPIAPAEPAPTAFAADAGAALETAGPDDAFASGPQGGAGFDRSAFDFRGLGADDAPALASGPAPQPAAPAQTAAAAAPSGLELAAAHPSAAAAAAAVPRAAAGAAAPPPSRGPRGRLRAFLVNAVALAALLLVALALLVAWRTEGPLDASALRPAAVLAALRRGGAAAGPFAAVDVRSGLYERERAPPVLFVRGNVVSRADAPVRALEVAVEVVRGEEVLARGAAVAGAVPTAEELHGAADAAALVAVARAAEQRAPRSVKPGETVPFLVAIADHPADLEGASLRVAVAPARSGAR